MRTARKFPADGWFEGHERAFRRAFVRHYPAVRWLLAHITRDRSEAQDHAGSRAQNERNRGGRPRARRKAFVWRSLRRCCTGRAPYGTGCPLAQGAPASRRRFSKAGRSFVTSVLSRLRTDAISRSASSRLSLWAGVGP